ncbi:MAG: hypothetical protein HQL64_07590 [Magnetococcales bacterium]|nr:hypothetical protein [Magnetococcales bacterium]
MKPPSSPCLLSSCRPAHLLPVLLGLTFVWSTPLQADIFECVNRASGDRVWRNRPCDPNENRAYQQVTTPTPAKEKPSSNTSTTTTSPGTAPGTTQAPDQQATAAPSPVQQSGVNKPEANQSASGPSDPNKPPPDNKAGTAAPSPADPSSSSSPPAGTLADVDHILMVAARRKESTDGLILMKFQYRNAKANREIQWESKPKKILASCSLILDQESSRDDPSEKGKVLHQGSGLLGSWQDSFTLHIPADYLSRTEESAFGRVECDFELPKGKRLHTRTVPVNKIPLTNKK